jgi:threonine synthase
MNCTPDSRSILRGIHASPAKPVHDPRTLARRLPALRHAAARGLRPRRDPAAAVRRCRATPTLWRYRELLPLEEGDETSLGEGFTPLLAVAENVWVKDEARNPTGSFKARGMALAVSMAKHLGAKKFSAPSAGNAAGALAAYGARAGLPVVVAMPDDTPKPFFDECELYGATIHRVHGTIADAGKYLREHGPKDAYDVSTLREPYRIEGKKTMAYELVEQLDGAVPDVVLYPTGGGTGLVGMWKAFDEMAALGWIPRDRRPRFVSVQAAGLCARREGFPRRRGAHEAWAECADSRLRSASPGAARRLHLPARVCARPRHGDRYRGSGDAAGDVELAARSGIDVCPEGGAAWAALAQLRQSGFVRPSDQRDRVQHRHGLKYR